MKSCDDEQDCNVNNDIIEKNSELNTFCFSIGSLIQVVNIFK